MSKGAHRFTDLAAIARDDADPRAPRAARELSARGYLCLHEGKTFHHYTDRWDVRPRYAIHVDRIRDRPDWLAASGHYRLAFRDIAGPTNERTGIFCLLPPGVLCGNTAPCERQPRRRAIGDALLVLAIANSHPFDWCIRQKATTHVNLFVLNGCPWPATPIAGARRRLLVHHALRLSCNHRGYAALWRGQMGDRWREPGRPAHRWPVVPADRRRSVRAAIDAVVADSYGLSREQYAHLLASFSHKSDPDTPSLCLAAFDELRAAGIEAFCTAQDPYRDVPVPTPSSPLAGR